MRLPYVYYMQVGNFGGFNLVVVKKNRQTTKFNSPPNFPVIRYMESNSLC